MLAWWREYYLITNRAQGAYEGILARLISSLLHGTRSNFFYFESSVFCEQSYGEHYMARLPCHKMIINKDCKKPTYLSKTKKQTNSFHFSYIVISLKKKLSQTWRLRQAGFKWFYLPGHKSNNTSMMMVMTIICITIDRIIRVIIRIHQIYKL